MAAEEVTPKTKLCKVCAQEINASAKKCIHCDSYQDWQSKLGLSTNILSLLVAFITVATAAIAAVVALLPHDSEFVASIQSADPGNLKLAFLVSNTGTRPGSLREALLYRENRGQPLKFNGSESMPLVIDPGKTILIDARPDYFSLTYGNEAPDLSGPCVLSLSISNFSGKLNRVSVPCPASYGNNFWGTLGERLWKEKWK
jgi:hypothetical protein